MVPTTKTFADEIFTNLVNYPLKLCRAVEVAIKGGSIL